MMLSAIMLSMLMILHQAFDLWQQLELASELESDLLGNVDWCRKWFVDFNAGKTGFI